MALYSRGNARRSLINTVQFRAVSQVATVVGYVVMVRGMAAQDFGVYNLLYTFIPAISTFASLGLEQTLRRYQPEYLSAGNAPAAGWLVRFVARARLTTNFVLFGLILLAWNLIAPVLKLQDYRLEFVLFCPLMVLFFQARILQLSLAAHMLHRFSVGAAAVLAVAKLIGYSGFVRFDELTVQKAMLVDTVGHAAAYLLVMFAYRRYCLPAARSTTYRSTAAERSRLLRYGFFNNFNDAGTYVLSTKSDNFFVAALMNTVSVGVYSFYNRLNEMSASLSPLRLFDNIIQPLFFAIPAAEAAKKVPRYFSLLLNTNLLFRWPVFAFAMAYHTEIVNVLFGGKFVEHSWLLPMIVAFGVVNTLDSPVSLVAQYEEKAAIILASKITGVYNVLALLVLLPVAGLYGAVFASGSARTLKMLYVWWHVRDLARWSNAWGAIATGVLVWGGAIGACYGLKLVIGSAAIPNLAAGAVVCGVAWLVFVRTGALSQTDRTMLGSLLRGREARLIRVLGLIQPEHSPAPKQ